MINFSVYVDQAGALALIALLSMAYGSISRHFENQNLATIALGTLFGIVAVMQMHAPLVISDGLILDMRNIPIALAGAFLGFRGMLTCLVIAICARFAIGGIGWVPGVIGMTVAGFAGTVWAHATRTNHRRTLWPLIGLGALMSMHLVGAFWFPWDTAVWFFTNVAPFLVCLNLFTIPIVGALLEQEAHRIKSKQNALNSKVIEPITRMLQKDAFLQELTHRKAAVSPQDVSGVMILTIRRQTQFKQFLGQKSLDTVLGAIRVRLIELMTHGDGTGVTQDGRILVALSADEVRAGESWHVILCRSIRDTPIILPDNLPIRVMLSHEILKTTDISDIESYLSKAPSKQITGFDGAQDALPTSQPLSIKTFPDDLDGMPATGDVSACSLSKGLFAKAELLMQRV